MAIAYKNEHGTLNGTTAVTVVSAPGSGITRLVAWISIANTDSASVTVTLNLADSGPVTRQLVKATLAVGESLLWEPSRPLALQDANESIQAVMDAAATTTNPDYVSSFAEVS